MATWMHIQIMSEPVLRGEINLRIFDKAAWQIDNGMDKDTVINHFTLMFEWLKNHNMLSKDGLDILDIGIDNATSLNEQLVTEEGAEFLTKYYDKLISESEYNVSLEGYLLSSYYSKFKA